MRYIAQYGRRGSLLVGIVLVCLYTSRVDAQTPTPISACGNISGSVILTTDLLSSNGVCLTVSANNTTIDGNGHTITVTGGGVDKWAVYNTNHSGLLVNDVTSGQGVYIYGSSNSSTVQNSTLGNVTVVGADDVTVTQNTLSGFSTNALTSDPPYRTVFTHNTVSGTGSTLTDFNGSDGTTCPPAVHFVVTDNTFTSDYQCGSSGQPACNEPKVVFMRCAGGNTVSRNVIRSTGQAMPARFRDAFDDSTVSDNTFWASGDLSPDGAFGALNITSGNVDKHFPQNNTFTNNVVRSDQNNAFYFESTGTGNTFTSNTFIANSGNYVGTLGGAADGSTFNHNTFYNNGGGSVVHFSSRSTTYTNIFTNNIFSGIGAIYSFDCSAQQCSPTYYQGDYNLFQNRNGTAAFGSFGATFGAMKSFITPDDAHSLEANPQFTNAAIRDFSLQAGSPALNSASDGTNIGAWQSSACVESWSCGAFGTCTNNTQSRTCTDSRNCGTILNRPALTQSCDSTAPTVSVTAPTNATTVSGTISVTATASDNVGVVGVQFKLDGANLGAEDTTAPYSMSWNTTSATNATHTLTAVARDAAGFTTTSSTITVTVNNSVACTEDWVTIPCSAWSTCSNGTQTRTCTDFHSCGTTNSRPALTQTCSVDTTAPAQVLNLQAV